MDLPHVWPKRGFTACSTCDTVSMHTGELRVPKSQGRNCDQTSLNQDWKWKNGPRYINKGDYVAFCWKYISSICRKRKWIYPMSGKSYICANSAFTWFLKVHRIKFSERQTSLGSFCLILECRQIYSRQNCRTRVTSSGILLCNISELQTPTVPPAKPSERPSQKQSCSKWSFRPVGGGCFRPMAEDR